MYRVLVGVLVIAGCSKSNVINQDNSNTTNNFISQVVGPTGATLDHKSGARINIPPGALSTDIELRLGTVDAAMAPALPAGMTAKSPFYSTEPTNLSFALNVVLNLPHTAGVGADITLLRGDPGGSWEPIPTSLKAAQFVVADSKVFGLYVIATASGVDGGSVMGADGSFLNVCGNGASDPGEDCDDGARADGDGCDSMCKRELDYDCGDTACRRIGELLVASTTPGPVWAAEGQSGMDVFVVSGDNGPSTLMRTTVRIAPNDASELITIGSGSENPITSLSVNSTHVYWVDDGQAIMRASLRTMMAESFVARGTETVFRAFASGSSVVWTEGLANPSGGKLRSLSTSMPLGTPTNVAGIDETDPLFSLIGDQTSGLIYTVHTSSGAVKIAIQNMALPIVAANNPTDIVASSGAAGTTIAWIEENGAAGGAEVKALTVPFGWMPPAPLPASVKVGDADLIAASAPNARDNRLFLEGTFVYWSNPTSGSVVRAPVAGGPTETIIDIGLNPNSFQPTAIFVFMGHLFFASQGDGHRQIALTLDGG